jgi:uncharacterized delta-60 repeat protein
MKKISLKILSLLLVGVSTLVASQTLASSSSVDSNFKTGTPVGFDFPVQDIAVQNDGKIIAAGLFTSYRWVTSPIMTRLNVDGTKDPLFQTSLVDGGRVDKFAIKNDGKITIVWENIYVGGWPKNVVTLNSNWSFDTWFSVGAIDYQNQDMISSLAIQNDGKIIVGGVISKYNWTNQKNILRLNTGWTIDSSFNIWSGFTGWNFSSAIRSIKIQNDGKIIVWGDFTSYKGVKSSGIIRLNTDGSIDSGFDIGSGFAGYSMWDNMFLINNIEIQSDGKIVVAWFFKYYQNTLVTNIVRLNTDWSRDTSFDTNSAYSNTIWALNIQSDGKILIYIVVNGNQNVIYRLNTDGSRDTSFNIGKWFDSFISKIASQNDGKIIVGGWFITSNELPAGGIIRLNSDWWIDSSFNIGDGFNGMVLSTVIQPDGKIIVGWTFKGYKWQIAQWIIRLNASWVRDNSFNIWSGFDWNVRTLTLQNNGRIIVGGGFGLYNWNTANELIRLMPDWSKDTSFITYGFSSYANYFPNVMVTTVQSDGKILVGGNFNTYSW